MTFVIIMIGREKMQVNECRFVLHQDKNGLTDRQRSTGMRNIKGKELNVVKIAGEQHHNEIEKTYIDIFTFYVCLRRLPHCVYACADKNMQCSTINTHSSNYCIEVYL